jgi:mono/diheme cytochrome c family protein
MPSFDRLSKADLDAVIDYVLMLTHRGELETSLGYEAEAEEELDPDYIPEYATDIVDGWHTAEYSTVRPLTPMPEFTAEHVNAGRKAFLSKGCSKCHAEDGRGHMPGNIGKDVWGHTTSAADLTSGMLRGGQRPEDIYQRIFSGINGTPMPAFANTLKSEPETLWNLVAYVLHVSNTRRPAESKVKGKPPERLGITPPAGLLKPYPTAASEEVESGDGGDDTDDDDDDE